ncbi:hypothetical protein [Gordonia sp. CPCC 205333]|uniref:hypothetical protein n=1 Tax=Gordonia sp. CPCC 205333 TaxID=3140790 RepID=UPI003AF35BC8
MSGTPLAEVVGQNCKRLRTDGRVTMDALASTAREYGLRWNTGRVGDFEGGRVSPTLPTLFVVAAALSRALGRPVHLYELMHDYEQNYNDPDAGMIQVEVNEVLTVPDFTIAQALRGEPVRLPSNEVRSHNATAVELMRVTGKLEPDDELDAMVSMYQNAGLTEQRLARDLDTDLATIVAASHRLWQAGFTTERDRRAGTEANAQKRGQVTRTMKDELRQAIEASNGDD